MSEFASEVPVEARALWFTARETAEVRVEPLREPHNTEIVVKALYSLVSPGTEMLVYKGEVPGDEDLGLETGEGTFAFPVKYAYQVVGTVIAAAAGAHYPVGATVFARHPHQDYFVIRSDNWLVAAVPPQLSPERAAFVNLLEVALNAQLDVPILHGEVVVVFGHGPVGDFVAQLARRTAGTVVVVDPIEARQHDALGKGATAAASPRDAFDVIQKLSDGRGADVCIDASGSPDALQAAIRATAQEGTVVVLSFFGARAVPLTLAPEFHFGRLRLVSSQVSNIDSRLLARWSFARRTATAFELLSTDWFKTSISHVIPFLAAPSAYRLLAETPELTTGVLLKY